MAAAEKAKQLIDDNAVVVFSKSYCPYCRSTKRLLDSLGAKYLAIELDQECMCPPRAPAFGAIANLCLQPMAAPSRVPS